MISHSKSHTHCNSRSMGDSLSPLHYRLQQGLPLAFGGVPGLTTSLVQPSHTHSPLKMMLLGSSLIGSIMLGVTMKNKPSMALPVTDPTT
jgi:hypothetical protein